MKNPVGSLILFLTVMVSAMSLYLNLDSMLYGEELTLINTLASGAFLLVWVVLLVYSYANHGRFSRIINLYWFSALVGAAFCVITVSGLTRILEYAAYALLFLLTPLFGLRIIETTHLAWSGILAGIAFCFALAGSIAASPRLPAPEPSAPAPEPSALAPEPSAPAPERPAPAPERPAPAPERPAPTPEPSAPALEPSIPIIAPQ